MRWRDAGEIHLVEPSCVGYRTRYVSPPPSPPYAPPVPPAYPREFLRFPGSNCYGRRGSLGDIDFGDGLQLGPPECEHLCMQTAGCTAITVQRQGPRCWRRRGIDLSLCRQGSQGLGYDTYIVFPLPPPSPMPLPPPPLPPPSPPPPPLLPPKPPAPFAPPMHPLPPHSPSPPPFSPPVPPPQSPPLPPPLPKSPPLTPPPPPPPSSPSPRSPESPPPSPPPLPPPLPLLPPTPHPPSVPLPNPPPPLVPSISVVMRVSAWGVGLVGCIGVLLACIRRELREFTSERSQRTSTPPRRALGAPRKRRARHQTLPVLDEDQEL